MFGDRMKLRNRVVLFRISVSAGVEGHSVDAGRPVPMKVRMVAIRCGEACVVSCSVSFRLWMSIQFVDQFLLGEGDRDRALLGKTPCGRELVVVAVLPEACLAWHHNDPLAEFERGDDRAHARVGNHEACRLDARAEFRRVDEWLRADVFRAIVRWPRLRDDVCPAVGGRPFIECADQAVKPPLRSDCRKNHITDPV